MRKYRCIQELVNGLYDIFVVSNDIEEKEMVFNVLKFIDTYDISIQILRESKPEYNEESEVKNITRFIQNYEEDIKILKQQNEKVVQYVKWKRNKNDNK